LRNIRGTRFLFFGLATTKPLKTRAKASISPLTKNSKGPVPDPAKDAETEVLDRDAPREPSQTPDDALKANVEGAARVAVLRARGAAGTEMGDRAETISP